MKRHLAPLPAGVRPRDVAAATRQRFPNAVDVNEVDDDGTASAAVYFAEGDAPTQAAVTAWRNDVAAAAAQPDNDGQETTAISDRLAQVQAKARAILADPAGSADWTAAERKLLLAVLVLRLGR